MNIATYQTAIIDPPSADKGTYASVVEMSNYRLFKRRHKMIAKICKEAEKKGWKYKCSYLDGLVKLEVHRA